MLLQVSRRSNSFVHALGASSPPTRRSEDTSPLGHTSFLRGDSCISPALCATERLECQSWEMASEASALDELHSELTCPVCLELFREPVILECGHHFCRQCITQCWDAKPEESPTCPQCRKTCTLKLRPNSLLCNVVESVRRARAMDTHPREASVSPERNPRPPVSANSPELVSEPDYCEEHEEKLKLYCEDDQIAICLVCGMSRDHKTHSVIPINEAFENYKSTRLECCLGGIRAPAVFVLLLCLSLTLSLGLTTLTGLTSEKLSVVLQRVEVQREEASCCQTQTNQKMMEIKEQASTLEDQISWEFVQLRELLQREEEEVKAGLRREKEERLRLLDQTLTHTTQQISALELTAQELHHKLREEDHPAQLRVREGGREGGREGERGGREGEREGEEDHPAQLRVRERERREGEGGEREREEGERERGRERRTIPLSSGERGRGRERRERGREGERGGREGEEDHPAQLRVREGGRGEREGGGGREEREDHPAQLRVREREGGREGEREGEREREEGERERRTTPLSSGEGEEDHPAQLRVREAWRGGEERRRERRRERRTTPLSSGEGEEDHPAQLRVREGGREGEEDHPAQLRVREGGRERGRGGPPRSAQGERGREGGRGGPPRSAQGDRGRERRTTPLSSGGGPPRSAQGERGREGGRGEGEEDHPAQLRVIEGGREGGRERRTTPLSSGGEGEEDHPLSSGVIEGGREGGRGGPPRAAQGEREREGGREGGREGERERGREGEICC
ncbi:hypothetical protein JZ751_015401 [Albula glossodonta]|uniref:Uncharacterized protein n=1 Tax=Albula glossodonta TaxID=121402 RepID=A0A8T2MVA6_9TELE|nr:hypothetical protein JZ751_015401 [Albula glossodonta]